MSAQPAEYGAAWSAGLRRGTDAELRAWVDAALGWCDATDAVAMRYFRRDLDARRKADQTFVTAADTTIERLIRDRIGDAYPHHGVLGEELGEERPDAAVRWYVDPIDGTHNFLRGIPVFGTLLAAERDGEMQAAVISAPALHSRWYAWRGGGAWAIDGGDPARRIHVSSIDTLAEAQVLYAGSADVEASGRGPGFRGLLASAWRERGLGDFWGYALVAEGAAEVMIEVDLSIWDIAGPSLLIEEAGGRISDFEGRRILDGGTILATNGVLHETVRSALVRGDG
ncbi:MAG TPA: inositol monophosphatase family protein [Candidatus Eisenbacteria bacterium]|nr:inositol monophosphatase family protein [Candidatus Eisenbacteria bacterium]